MRAGRGAHRAAASGSRRGAARTGANRYSPPCRPSPSISRTSLLTGKLRSGGQAEEKAGFAAFWGNQQARAVPQGRPGRRSRPRLNPAGPRRDPRSRHRRRRGAQHDRRHARPGPARPGPHWAVDQVAYLGAVLDEAGARAGRSSSPPTTATCSTAGAPSTRPESESARYRTGTPGTGEITVRGPRVLVARGRGRRRRRRGDPLHAEEGGLPRRRVPGRGGGAGHRAAAVRVARPGRLASLRSQRASPRSGGIRLRPHRLSPAQTRSSPRVGGRRPALRNLTARCSAFSDVMASADPGAAGVAGEDGRVPVPSGHKSSRRDAWPASASSSAGPRTTTGIAALIDGLDKAGGKATIGEAARMAGEPAVRMSGYLAQVARLLNVDGYPVIRTIDDGRTVELNSRAAPAAVPRRCA